MAIRTVPNQFAILLLTAFIFQSFATAIFHQRAVQFAPYTSGDPSLSPTATVFVQQQNPRSLLAQSIEPLMAAALSSMSLVPNSYAMSSRSMPLTQSSPYGTFARFTATSAHPSNLYNTQWNVLPFSAGRYCDDQIVNEPEYQRCRADSALNWRAAEHNLDGRASIDPMRACCFFWSVLSCMEDSVKRRCGDRATLDYFRMRRNELRASLESPYGICSSYQHNAFRCSLQSWIIIIAFMILTAFILLVIISIVWVLVVRKRRKDVGHSSSGRAVESSSGRSFNPFRSQQTEVRRVSPSRSPRVPDIERPPQSPHHLQYSTSRQISL